MINSIECFFQIYKYTTAKFIIINGLANIFRDRDRSMGSRTFFSETKPKWIKNFKFFQLNVEAMIHSFFKQFTKVGKYRNWSIIVFVKS